MNIKMKLVGSGKLPKKAHDTDGGFDVYSRIEEPIVLRPGETVAIPAGFILELESGYKALMTPRGGLAIKNGITVLNSPGLVDTNYRDEVMVILHNSNPQVLYKEFLAYDNDGVCHVCEKLYYNKEKEFTIEPNMRIAQMQIEVDHSYGVEFEVVASVNKDTDRGIGKFSSTGLK